MDEAAIAATPTSTSTSTPTTTGEGSHPSLRSTWSTFPVHNSDGTVIPESETPPRDRHATSPSSPSTTHNNVSGSSDARTSSTHQAIKNGDDNATPTSVLARLVAAATTSSAMTTIDDAPVVSSNARIIGASIDDVDISDRKRLGDGKGGNGSRSESVSGRLSARGRMQLHQTVTVMTHSSPTHLSDIVERDRALSLQQQQYQQQQQRGTSLSSTMSSPSRLTNRSNSATPSRNMSGTSRLITTSASSNVIRSPAPARASAGVTTSPRTPISSRLSRTVGFSGMTATTPSSTRASPRPSSSPKITSTSRSSSTTFVKQPSASSASSLSGTTTTITTMTHQKSVTSSTSSLAQTIPRLDTDQSSVSLSTSSLGHMRSSPLFSVDKVSESSGDLSPTLHRMRPLASPLPSSSALQYLKQGDARDMTNPTARYKIKVVHSLIEQIHLILNVLHEARPRGSVSTLTPSIRYYGLLTSIINNYLYS
jgi:hypothetical protein